MATNRGTPGVENQRNHARAEISRVLRSRQEAGAAYDKLSRWYDWLSGPAERGMMETGLRMLGAQRGERILEIGPGTGHALVTLSNAVGESGKVCGLDVSPGMLHRASLRAHSAGLAARVVLQRADATLLPFRSSVYDAIFMSFTLELFDTPDIPIVLAECWRVLCGKGRIGVVAMSKEASDSWALRLYERAHNRFPSYVDCRPIFARRAMQQAGFQVVEATQQLLWGLPIEIVLATR